MLLTITIIALIVAAGLGMLAWRLSQDERRRSEARVAALLASLNAEMADPDAPTRPILRLRDAVPADRAFFANAAQDTHDELSRIAWVAVVAFVLVVGAAAAWLALRAFNPPAPSGMAATTSAPLELLSLTSTRRGADLSIAGRVRNPASGGRLDGITAVVLFFDARGAFLISARARLDGASLVPGHDCSFLVSVTAPDGVSRYRVSFRADAGGIVQHIDRRPTPSGGRDQGEAAESAERRARL